MAFRFSAPCLLSLTAACLLTLPACELDLLVADESEDPPGDLVIEVARPDVPDHPSVDLGSRGVCAVETDGRLVCWGDFSSVVSSSSSAQVEQHVIEDETSWRSASAGDAFACGIQETGALWCWGYWASHPNRQGAVKLPPGPVGDDDDWAQVSARGSVCALKTDGSLWCWGDNPSGFVGEVPEGGIESYPTTPVLLDDGPFTHLSMGWGHGCAVHVDSSLWCWGQNLGGQLGVEEPSLVARPMRVPFEQPVVDVAVGGTSSEDSSWQKAFTCALTGSGELWCWGDPTSGSIPLATPFGPHARLVATGVVDVEAGAGHLCFLDQSGDILCAGRNDHGQLGRSHTSPQQFGLDKVSGSHTWVDLGAGKDATCAVDDADRVFCWGMREGGTLGDGVNWPYVAEPTPVAGDLTFASFSTGAASTAAVTHEGELFWWGSADTDWRKDHQQTPTPLAAQPSGWKVAARGAYQRCAIDLDDKLWCWGRNWDGQAGVEDDNYLTVPAMLVPDAVWAEVSTGVDYSCAIEQSSRALYCFGTNDEGQLGDGTTDPAPTPRLIAPSMEWRKVAAGDGLTCGIDQPGALHCWGEGGRVGDGTEEDRLSPTAIGGPEVWVDVDTGGRAACAITDAGALHCWGVGPAQAEASLAPIPVLPEQTFVDVAMGRWHGCALTDQGQLFCWGGTGVGPLLGSADVFSSAEPVLVDTEHTWKAVDSLYHHTCALDVDDHLFCWGQAGGGQIGDGTAWQTTPQEVVLLSSE